MKLITVISAIAMLTLVGIVPTLQAAGTMAPTVRGDQYHMATAKTHNIHAHDYARLLSKYAAASDEPVPGAVIKEHVDAIRANTKLARESYNRLSADTKKDQRVSKQLAEISARLAKADELIEQLEAQSKQESIESKAVIAKVDALSMELKATHMANKVIDQAFIQSAQREVQSDQFSNRQSYDYYFTGEGHFID